MATLSEIAANASNKANEVLRLLKELNLPEPSFGETGAYDFDALHEKKFDEDALQRARNDLINAAHDLAQLAMGPADYLCSMSWSAAKIANLGSIVRLEVPQRIPLGGTRKLSDLVAEIGLPENTTTKVIRYAIANGLFYEDPVGVIGHSAASSRLAIDRDMHNYIIMFASDVNAMLAKFPETLARQSVLGDRAPKSAANLAFPEYVDLFDYFEKRTDAAQRYSTYLASRARIPVWSIDFLTTAWDWDSVGSGTIVDMGASAGSAAVLLAQAFPNLHIVNQDIAPEALKEGRANIEQLGLSSRITFVEHDFFTPQNLSARAYMFKSILHDWSDKDCVRILKALVPAMEDGAHVLIVECLMPAPPSSRAGAWKQEAKRVEDHIMIAAHGAQERTLEQFEAIFSEASENWSLNSVVAGGNGSSFSLIDFVYDEGSQLFQDTGPSKRRRLAPV